jgi:[ribosomal protein S5]-alanine N-acetyltransferase
MIYVNNDNTLRLVPFDPDVHYTDTYKGWFYDPVVTQYNSHGLFPYTKAQQEAFMAAVQGNDQSRIVWAIEHSVVWAPDEPMKAEWSHIGNISLQSINMLNRSAEIAIVIGDTNTHRTGVGTFACSKVLDHAFIKLGLHRVWTGTLSINLGMCNVAKKIGMVEEGRFRQGVFRDGMFEDVVVYSILEDEYFKR